MTGTNDIGPGEPRGLAVFLNKKSLAVRRDQVRFWLESKRENAEFHSDTG